MSLRISCPHCKATIKAPPPTYGKALRCPKCSEHFTVPIPAPPIATIIPDALLVAEENAILAELTPAARPVDDNFDDDPPRRRRAREDSDDYEPARRGRVQLVEQTGKEWKIAQLLGALGLIGGIFLICSGIAGQFDTAVMAGVPVTGISLFVFCIGRIGAWWHHG